MKDLKLNSGDIYVINGQIQTVEKEEKLNQQIGKVIITSIGNYLHQNYGSVVMSLLGKPQVIGTDGELKGSIRSALDYFIRLQKPNMLLKLYDPEEVLYKVLGIQISHPDPRASSPTVLIMNAKQNNIEVSFNL